MSDSNIKADIIINFLVNNYLKGSLAFSLEPKDANLMTWTNQEAFLDATVYSELLRRYPVKNEFSKQFFKKLISFIEPHQEVHDDLYQFLCSTMENESSDIFCHRHYVIDIKNRDIITIKETNNMVINGTTGMKTWEAALMLADWTLCHPEIFLHKKVLELGSGVGFTGITIAKHCKIKSIVLTDCHDDVLKAIKENILINIPHCKDEENPKPSIDAMMLDWNDDDKIPGELVPDVVIGADIVYDPSIIQPLCNVLQILFDRNDRLEVYIASIIRNEDTFKTFLMTLEDNNFTFCKIFLECSKFIVWDYSNQQRCLLKIIRHKKQLHILGWPCQTTRKRSRGTNSAQSTGAKKRKRATAILLVDKHRERPQKSPGAPTDNPRPQDLAQDSEETRPQIMGTGEEEEEEEDFYGISNYETLKYEYAVMYNHLNEFLNRI